MISSSRAVAAWLTLAGLAFLASVAVISLRYSVPPPRWDLIGCFGLAAAGITGALVTVRKRTFTDLGGVSSLAWWPDLRAPWKSLGRIAWFLTLVALIGAVLSFSPGVGRMVEEGHVIDRVKVIDVLSAERKVRDKTSEYFAVKARASVPYADGDKTETVAFEASYPVKPGDQVWALYAPSAPQLGVVLEDARDQLEEQVGGPGAGTRWYLSLVMLLALAIGALVQTSPGLPRFMKPAFKERRVRRLPVRVTAGTAAMAARAKDSTGESEIRPVPVLTLEGPEGERVEASVSDRIDPIALVGALANHPATALYWIASGANESKGVLAAGDSCIRCDNVAPAEGSSLSRGESATAVTEARGKSREVRQFPEWSAEQHTAGFIWILFTLLLMGVIALGVGVIASIVLGVIAFLASLFGWQLASIERREALEKLLPESQKPHSEN